MRRRFCVAAVAAAGLARCRGFNANVRFETPAERVTDKTVLPTKDELDKLLPTLAELKAQLPSAAEMEAKHVHKRTAEEQLAAAVASPPVAPDDTKPLWPDADTPQEILEDEKYGEGADENAPAPTPQQVALAWRALGWGTVWAVIIVTACSVVAAWFAGFSSWSQVVAHLRGHEDRELERARALLRRDGSAVDDASIDVQHFVLDLSNPAEVPAKINEIMAAIDRLAQEQSADAK